MCAASFLTVHLFFAHVVLGIGTAWWHAVSILTHVVNTVHEVIVELHRSLLLVTVGHVCLDFHVVAIAFKFEVLIHRLQIEVLTHSHAHVFVFFWNFLLEIEIVPLAAVIESSSIIW